MGISKIFGGGSKAPDTSAQAAASEKSAELQYKATTRGQDLAQKQWEETKKLWKEAVNEGKSIFDTGIATMKGKYKEGDKLFKQGMDILNEGDKYFDQMRETYQTGVDTYAAGAEKFDDAHGYLSTAEKKARGDLEEAKSLYEPYAKMGKWATAQLQAGAESGLWGRAEEKFEFDSEDEYIASDAFQNRLMKAQESLKRDRNAKGGGASGATLKALRDQSFGLAAGDYERAYKRAMGEYNIERQNRQAAFGRMSSMAGIGMQGVEGQARLSGQQAGISMQAGQAQAGVSQAEAGYQAGLGQFQAGAAYIDQAQAGYGENKANYLAGQASYYGQQGANIANMYANKANIVTGGAANLSAAGQHYSGQISQLGIQGANAMGAGMMGAANAQVQGQVYQQQASQQSFDNMMSVIGLGLGIFSDARLKDDGGVVGYLNNGIPIHLFRYKHVEDSPWQIGVMAQEIEEVMPEAVGERNGFKTVDYQKVTQNGQS